MSKGIIQERLKISIEERNLVIGFMGDTYAFLTTHIYWNDLMPVVEKIAKTQLTYENVNETYYPYPRTFGMLDDEGNFLVRLNCAPLFSASTLIEATWLAVIYFIQNSKP